MFVLVMRPQEKGLSKEEIKQILEFDWNNSADEESDGDEEDESGILESNLQDLVEKAEDIEIGLLEDIIEKKEDEVTDELEFQHSYVKIDQKSLRWRSRTFDIPENVWKGELILDKEIKTPIEYFTYFFGCDAINLIKDQSNLFALQEFGIEMKCTEVEIRRYIGVLLYLGVLKLPQFKMAWSRDLKLTAISDSLTRSRFEKIKECLHFNDNSKQAKVGDLNYDKLYKIRPLLDIVKEKCNSLPQEEHQSIDEQIIAFKGVHVHIFLKFTSA